MSSPPTPSSKNIKLGIPNHEGQMSMLFSKGGSREGAGRKGFGETRKVSLTLSAEVWQALEAHCIAKSCSKSEALRGMIETYLHNEHSEGR
ncbi:hypothetical protein SAMN05518855_1007105 [Paenibacillus sp. CF384]|nr:hypothetical protein SAMN05518855_1007105 [Paenibacillus sp. CF384]